MGRILNILSILLLLVASNCNNSYLTNQVDDENSTSCQYISYYIDSPDFDGSPDIDHNCLLSCDCNSGIRLHYVTHNQTSNHFEIPNFHANYETDKSPPCLS
nr:hypothetical protein [uncultured Carboxylicivirga sp.]